LPDSCSSSSSAAANGGEQPSSQQQPQQQQPRRAKWFVAGPGVLLAQQDGLLVQYDAATRSPVGLVTKDAEGERVEGCVRFRAERASGEKCLITQRTTNTLLLGKTVTLVTADGGAPRAADGSDVAAVLLARDGEGEVERFERNEFGGFFTIYQHNKWVARKKAEAEAAAAAAAQVAAA
jgi:hypothetical protein